MQALTAQAAPIAGIWHLQRLLRTDERGSFARLFDAGLLANWGWDGNVQQVNHSHTKQAGTVRGMHWQAPPWADWKLVTCLRGQVFDVALDLRQDSPTFLKWHAQVLNADQGDALLIPPGCAHGFQALTNDVELVYCHSQPYQPSHDHGLNPLDPAFNIAWPQPVRQLSDKDQQQARLTPAFTGVVL